MSKIIAQSKVFGGTFFKYEHESRLLGCPMKVSIFVPEQVNASETFSAVYFLSGLTCNEDNFITKAGACRSASKLKLILICPDTSPRGLNIEGDSETWQFGVGAGYYLDATVPKWKNYQMYSYILNELADFVKTSLPVNGKFSIMGHSMGGHGAITIGLKNPGAFQSISAFAPIANPIACDLGKKAFTGFLGSDTSTWSHYDSTELAKTYSGRKVPVLVDQGSSDSFYVDNVLLTDNFVSTAKSNASLDLEYHLRPGYDHGYWFIQSFIANHLEFHAKYLSA